jgi:translation elongation factor EF-Tu-like GTPase
MSKFRFKVKDIGEITGRGLVVTGDILDGMFTLATDCDHRGRGRSL